MNLQSTDRGNRSLVHLENDTEARLFADVGIGLVSIKGVRLALTVMRAQADNQWPVDVLLSNRRLVYAGQRMTDEAARLGVVGALPGFGEYPDAVENETALRSMAVTIETHFEH